MALVEGLKVDGVMLEGTEIFNVSNQQSCYYSGLKDIARKNTPFSILAKHKCENGHTVYLIRAEGSKEIGAVLKSEKIVLN